jgi:hypothetical protein
VHPAALGSCSWRIHLHQVSSLAWLQFCSLHLLHCTVLYCTVLYCTVLCCTVLYCTVLYCTVLYCIVLTVLYVCMLVPQVLASLVPSAMCGGQQGAVQPARRRIPSRPCKQSCLLGKPWLRCMVLLEMTSNTLQRCRMRCGCPRTGCILHPSIPFCLPECFVIFL